MGEQALEGIKILDLTRILAGPYSTMILADMGADVIKIERPETGDDSRQFGPYVNEESAYFMSLNRNKRSITMNLKSEESIEVFFKMVKDADIVIENFRPGTMEKLGIGYDRLKEINPKIIYASSSGFGHTGPYSERPAYDAVVQAMGGVMSITGEKGGTPIKFGTSIADITAGLYTTIGILSALQYRNRTGKGQKIDIAMLDTQVSLLENAIARYYASGEIPEPLGNRHPSIIPFEDFETLDGSIMISAGNDSLWKKLCSALNLEDLREDERFKTNPLRGENYEELRPLLSQVFKLKDTRDWIKILNSYGIPNGPINNIEDIVNDPQIQAREMIVDVEHPKAGNMKMPGVPIKMSETQGSVRSPAPILGEHTDNILKEFGISDEKIEQMKANKSI